MSKASLAWYHDLKKDPERYAAYRAGRRAYRKSNPSAKGGDGDTAARRDRKEAARKKYILEWLQNHPCQVCEEEDTDCLQFHHLDPKTKDQSVSKMTKSSWVKIKAEIAKCVVLCANCHCKEHACLRRGDPSLLTCGE